jgi:hypothetical protein
MQVLDQVDINVRRGDKVGKFPDALAQAVLKISGEGFVVWPVSEDELKDMRLDIWGIPVCYHFNEKKDPKVFRLWPIPDRELTLTVRRIIPERNDDRTNGSPE